ncbi:hypothetical protein WJX84_005706 [Apatococcus fuscideae]|uniref:Uncharacterized protein n=1 Tax=Apatococcus fuscideae TaxID=2026836 RepID=A0AAW1SPI7_9CHLO
MQNYHTEQSAVCEPAYQNVTAQVLQCACTLVELVPNTELAEQDLASKAQILYKTGSQWCQLKELVTMMAEQARMLTKAKQSNAATNLLKSAMAQLGQLALDEDDPSLAEGTEITWHLRVKVLRMLAHSLLETPGNAAAALNMIHQIRQETNGRQEDAAKHGVNLILHRQQDDANVTSLVIRMLLQKEDHTELEDYALQIAQTMTDDIQQLAEKDRQDEMSLLTDLTRLYKDATQRLSASGPDAFLGEPSRAAVLEWFAAGSWNTALRASQAKHTGLSAELFASSGAFYSRLEVSQESLKYQEMCFLMSGASYLSPSPEAAQQAGTIATARSMLARCREANGRLNALLRGNMPADAGKMQLYLELQIKGS